VDNRGGAITSVKLKGKNFRLTRLSDKMEIEGSLLTSVNPYSQVRVGEPGVLSVGFRVICGDDGDGVFKEPNYVMTDSILRITRIEVNEVEFLSRGGQLYIVKSYLISNLK